MADIKLEELLDRIYVADKEEINPIISAITERFTEVWPQWELLALTIQGHDRESHIKALQEALELVARRK